MSTLWINYASIHFLLACHVFATFIDLTRGEQTDASKLLTRQWPETTMDDLSGDGSLSEWHNTRSYFETIVPAIYSSLSTSVSSKSSDVYVSSVISIPETPLISPSPTTSLLLTMDYSIDFPSSESDIEEWSMSNPSLPYFGPSSLLNTFLFQPSFHQSTPTPSLKTILISETSKLKEKSWWEVVDDVPATSQESIIFTPSPSSVTGSEDITQSSDIVDFSTERTIAIISTSLTISTQSDPHTSFTTKNNLYSSYLDETDFQISSTYQMLPSDSSSYPTIDNIDSAAGDILSETRLLSSRLQISESDFTNTFYVVDTSLTGLSIVTSGLNSTQSFSSEITIVKTTSQSDVIDYTLNDVNTAQSVTAFDIITTSITTGSQLFITTPSTSLLNESSTEIGSTTPKYDSSNSFDETTKVSTAKISILGSTESSTLTDMRYWLKTVVKAEPKILPINFLAIVEDRLGDIYRLAFSRWKDQLLRLKRATNQTHDTRIQFTRYMADWRNHQVELVYTVEYQGKPILAATAINVMDTIDKEEFSEMIGYSVIVKAEAYIQKAEIYQRSKPWLIYVIIGIIGGFILLLICLIALYCRYCHRKNKNFDVETKRMKPFGEQNKQKAFEEEIQRLKTNGQEEKSEPVRPLPDLPLHKRRESKRLQKENSEKIFLVTVETQTEGYYNQACESDITDSSLSTVTSTQTTPDKSSKEEPRKMQSPLNETISSEQDSMDDLFHYESSKMPTLLPSQSRSKKRMLGNALSDTDADRAEAEIQMGKMRQRIGELLDDAFMFSGSKHMYSSLRNKQILPTTDAFHRWTSLRSPRKQQVLKSQVTATKTADSLPDVEGREAHHEPLFIDLPFDKKPPIKPKIVWSIYKAGDEVSELRDRLEEQHGSHPASEISSEKPDKLFEHRKPPPSSISSPAQPDVAALIKVWRKYSLFTPTPSLSLIHPSFRPFSAPTTVNMTNTLRPPYVIDSRPTVQMPSSFLPVHDTIHEVSPHHHHPPYDTKKLSNERDEIDTATVLKFSQPAQSVIQAIKDELKKFNTSFPNDDTESFA